MKLKRLEIYGFKSFANRMVFDFSRGMTAVVGPNGCGKSNIADSIQWIFGEMSAKTLRGSGMTDVIFSGSKNRRAYGYAEGTLTFSNEDREVNIGADEISITRSINRSGESEYSINGERCRLIDIRILLQGTGLGTSDYSVIQQGAVEKLISSDSQSRRAVFDEAAGVSKYKYRRDKALRKLEKVDINLDRLRDRIESTERELRSLKRRASAARRYQEIDEEWCNKDRLLNNLKYKEVTSQLQGLMNVRDSLSSALTEQSVLEGQISADVAGKEDRVFSSEKKANNIERQGLQLENEVSQNENAIKWLSERMAEKKHMCEDKEEEINEIRSKIGINNKEIGKCREQIDAIDGEVAEKEEALSEKEENLKKARNEFSRVIEIIEGKKHSLAETFSQSSLTKNEMDTLKAEQKALTSSQQDLEAKLERLKSQHQELEEQLEHQRKLVGQKEREREKVLNTLDRKIEEKESLVERKETIQYDLSETNHLLTRIDSKLHLLRDLENKYEGISSGVKGIIEELKSKDSKLKGICGMVADFINVDIENETVIETALGENVQNIIVGTVEDALEAVGFLREHNLGKATFIPEERANVNGFEIDKRLFEIDGVECGAVDLIEYKKEHLGIIQQLLGKTIIVENMDAVLAIDGSLLKDVTVVTRDGYIMGRNGQLTGGSSQAMGGIISRKNEIKKLTEEYAEEKGKLEKFKQEYEEIDSKLENINKEIIKRDTDIEEINRLIGESRNLLLKDERDSIHINENIRTALSVVVSTGVRLEEIEEFLVSEGGKFNWFLKLSGLLEKEIESLEEKTSATARERDTLQKEISDLKIDRATTSGNKEIISEKVSHLQQAIDDCSLKIEKDEQLIAKFYREIKENRDAVEQKNSEVGNILENLKTVEQDLIARKNAAEKVRAEYDLLKSKYKSILSENKKQNEELKKVELELNNLDHVKNRIEEGVLQNHNLDIRQKNKNFVPPEEKIDMQELERDVKSLLISRNKITGADPTAIERLKSVNLRAEYLHVQKDDLEKARDSLYSLIKKINRQSSAMFIKTFEDIRESFKRLFRKLFGGGRADLILEPDKDVLDAGIDIMCRPPGSQLQSISLLSGGQKAMVVICLLFSVLQAKPSPLCLLDEIDGPLDEANVDRFLALVQEFMKESQFIVITHNKKTVSKADLIYGITMQEPGVSKKVSLKFEDIRRDERLLGKPEEKETAVAG